jgi:hypothetical protein
LLFLAKAGAKSCRFVRVDDHDTCLETFRATEGDFPAQAITASEWNFVVGKGSAVFKRLQRIPQKLSSVADLFVGVQTDADDVFILDVVRDEGSILVCDSKYTGHQHRFEKSHLK